MIYAIRHLVIDRYLDTCMAIPTATTSSQEQYVIIIKKVKAIHTEMKEPLMSDNADGLVIDRSGKFPCTRGTNPSTGSSTGEYLPV